MRILSSDVAAHVGKSVDLAGWLHKERKLGGLNFYLLRDRAGVVQVKVEDKAQVEKLRSLQIGTVLKVHGKVAKDERAPGGVEVQDAKIEVLVPVTSAPPIEIDKPLSHQPEHLETLLDKRVAGVRNLDEQGIFKIRTGINKAIRDHLVAGEFTEIQTPKLLAGATEGGAEVFKLDYFGKEATLAQSPQLYKQIMVGAYERVFEIGPAYRAEPSATTRHVSEVTMLDIEIGFIEEHEDVLKVVEGLTYQVATAIYKQYKTELAKLNAPKLVLKQQFPRYSVAQVHKLYSDATGKSTLNQKDLLPEEERWICDYAKDKDGCEAVFVTDFPIAAMKFYHMVNPRDTKTVLWADLLFRGVEIATCPMREHRLDNLIKQMKAAGLDPKAEAYKYYLQAFEYGLPPHGGCGFGIDRFTQKIIGLNNVKEAILFPRDMNRLAP